ncbi:TIGR03618 family F420-dependent PPOX class oxidoreductase [Streptomyces sp. NPDC047974]|uniref:pyridoxamine 5'-phosphate oxidase family protein n=1 Tax=Streptomyces sp. NPDC047974 TaxID=3154343 RepID=UPI0033C12D16
MSVPRPQRSPLRLDAATEAFLTENHVGTLTTVRGDGSPHAAPVRFTWDATAGLVRVMTVVTRQKVRNLSADGARAAICQVAGMRWITLEGAAAVSTDPERLQEGVRRYTRRYWSPPPQPPGLAVIEIAVDRVLGLG